MIIIVGLGNPGGKYEKTRHNVGFKAINKIAANFQFPRPTSPASELAGGRAIFNFQSKFNAQISENEINGEKVMLIKPQIFMNESGKALRKIMDYNKLQTDNLWVINDDIDIPLGNIKISKESGSAGHKGVESIIENLKSKDFIRFRIGIQPQKGKPKNVEKFVLQKFNKDEEKILENVIKKTAEAIEIAIKDGIEKAQSIYN